MAKIIKIKKDKFWKKLYEQTSFQPVTVMDEKVLAALKAMAQAK